MYLGHATVASSATEKNYNNFPPAPTGTTHAELQADTQAVRCTFDGETHPSTTVGVILLTTEPPRLFQIDDILRIRFVQGSGGAGNLNVHWIGPRRI